MEPKTCPFLGKECLKEKCALWHMSACAVTSIAKRLQELIMAQQRR
jgi:hypothetical protein